MSASIAKNFVVGRRSTLALGALLLVAGCSKQSPPTTEPSPATSPPASTSAETVAETTTPTSEPASAPMKLKVVSPLQIVAAREGSMELRLASGIPTLTMESEPVPVIDGQPRRNPHGDIGLHNRLSSNLDYTPTIAIAGDASTPGRAWVTTADHPDRGTSEYTVYKRVAQGWTSIDLARGLLEGYFAAYAERDGTQIALRVWAANPSKDHFATDDMGPKAEAYRRSVERALSKARPAWVRLSNAKTPLPKIPTTARPITAVTTADGSLHALAADTRQGSSATSVLTWPPGKTSATSVSLPDTPDASLKEARMSAAGDWILVAAWYREDGPETHAYLAVGDGKSWERVPVELPDWPKDSNAHILGMSRTAQGELWIAVGDRWDMALGDRPLWRKPADGPWQPVPLPTVDSDTFARGKDWVHMPLDDGGWVEIERGSVSTHSAMPTGLVYSDGAVWVAVEIDDAYDSEQMPFPIPRSLLLTTKAIAEPPAVLPSALELDQERRNRRRASMSPGSDGCTEVAVLLGSPAKPDVERITAALFDLPEDDGAGDPAQIELVYMGRLDGKDVLTASARVWDGDEAQRFSRTVSKATGVTPTLSCRIPHMVEPLRSLPSPSQ